MLTDADIISAQGCPEEISRLGNCPWEFAGEIAPFPNPPFSAIKHICQCQTTRVGWAATEPTEGFRHVKLFDLRNYPFVTNDKQVVTLYIGQCEDCGKVHWMYSRPGK